MDPKSGNLFRATSPTYMDDGTPKVQIPSHVFLHGSENQKEYVIGQFYRCSTPSGGLVHAVINRIRGRSCKIFTRRLSDSSFLFHIPDESTRQWFVQRSLWHVDDCLMFVAPWSPSASLELHVISTVPVWVTLKHIPNQLYSIPGISRIASGLGAPMATNKPRLDPSLMGEAKILVEVELLKQFPQKIALEDNTGKILMVQVEYSWIPSTCGRCGHLGHKDTRCLQQATHNHSIVSKPDDKSSKAQSVLVSTTSATTNASAFKNFVFKAVAAPTTESNDHLPVSAPETDVLPLSPTVFNSVTATVSDAHVSSIFNDPDQVPASLTTDLVVLGSAYDLDVDLMNKKVSATPLQVSENSSVVDIGPSTSQALSNSNDAPAFNDNLADILQKDLITTAGNMSSPTVMVDSQVLDKSRTHDNDEQVTVAIGRNAFAALESPEEYDVFSSDSSEDDELLYDVDQMTVSAQRILRDRPVKPSQKVQDMASSSFGRGRGNRGRRGRKGQGGRG